MNQNKQGTGAPGHVYLVGAGPGDPGLITVRGKQVLQKADVVLYDHLANPELLAFAPGKAERIDVGKERGHPKLSQHEIENILLERASRGLTVIRLKGGDPFVFGRGGEEGMTLQKAGIPFTVIPGVTSVTAAPAYAGIPVSHRDTNSRIVIMTGHDDPDSLDSLALDALTLPNQTLVILMGVEYFRKLARKLLSHKMAPETPVMMVRWGTTASQETREGTLGTMEEILSRQPIRPPALVVVGKVAGSEYRLNWQDNLPLFRKRILLTRETGTQDSLSETLTSEGAEVIHCPAIEIGPPESYSEIDRALESLLEYGWILFLSPNGVRYFMRRLADTGKDLRTLSSNRIFAMGPATHRALSEFGINPDGEPLESHGNGVLEFFRSQPVQNEPVLLIRGDRGDRLIPDGLREMGRAVTTVRCYVNRVPTLPDYLRDRITMHLEEKSLDLLVYYSPSAFENLVSLFPERADDIRRIPSLAIGPTTQAALRKDGVLTVLVPKEPTEKAVEKMILDYFHESDF
ncbi:MAG: uroporphyrinogen-III C-methyltransferase [Leptospirales bacterium]